MVEEGGKLARQPADAGWSAIVAVIWLALGGEGFGQTASLRSSSQPAISLAQVFVMSPKVSGGSGSGKGGKRGSDGRDRSRSPPPPPPPRYVVCQTCHTRLLWSGMSPQLQALRPYVRTIEECPVCAP